MGLKKYLISIEACGSPRLNAFFSQPLFASAAHEFKTLGIKGAELTVKEYFDQAVAGHSKPLTPGELGCTLSHLAALRDFLASDEKYAIVFEDDAIQDGNFSFAQIESELDQLTLEPVFFLSLGGIQLAHSQKVKGRFIEKNMLGRSVLKVHPYYYAKFVSAYAYIVDRKMAEILLHYHEVPQIFDHWGGVAQMNPQIHLYATYLFDHPPVVNAQGSYLEKERLQNTNPAAHGAAQKPLFQPMMKSVVKLFLKSYDTNFKN